MKWKFSDLLLRGLRGRRLRQGAIGRPQPVEPNGALGILELFSVATMIKAAEAAAKSAHVQLLEVRPD